MTAVDAAVRQAEAEGFALFFNERCVVCGSPPPAEQIGSVCDHEYPETTAIRFPVVRCPDCALVYLQPRPDVSELSRIYPARYFAYHMKTGSQAEGVLLRMVFRNQVRELRGRVRGLIGQRDRPLRILDVGAGSGRVLAMLQAVWPDAQTHAVDMEPRAIAALKSAGHETYEGRFEELEDLPQGHFDLVNSSHVIEHVPRPDLFLEKCASLLVPGGITMHETPDTGALSFALFGRRDWGTYHAPRHFYLFSRGSLEALARRLELELVDYRNYGLSVFPLWTLHSLAFHALGRRVSDALFPPVQFFDRRYPTLLLAGLGVLQRLSLVLTGRSSACWVALRRPT